MGGAGDGNFASILAKYSKTGELIWEKTLDTTNDNPINGVVLTENEDMIIAGSYFFCRVDKDGNILWYERFEQWNDDYYFDSVAIDKEENIYLETEAKLFKYDKDRNLVKEYPHENIFEEDMIYSKDKDEIILVERNIVDSGFDTEILVTGLDTDLNKKWEYKLTPPNNKGRYFPSKITEADDGYIIVGDFYSDISFDGIPKKGMNDSFILKIDKEGNKLWSNTYGGEHLWTYFPIGGQVENGNIVVLGDTQYYDDNNRDAIADEINIFEYSNETGELLKTETHLHSEQFSGSGISNISCSYGGVVSNENGYVFLGFTAFDEFDGLKPSDNPNFERYHSNSFVIYNTIPSKYGINKESKDGGKVKSSVLNATSGTKVTIDIELEKGYEVKSIKIVDKKGNIVEYNKISDVEYDFIMPTSDVTIDVEFVKGVSKTIIDKIINPETSDIPLFILIISFVLSGLYIFRTYRHMRKN